MTFKTNNFIYNFYLILTYLLNIIYFILGYTRLENVDGNYNVKFM